MECIDNWARPISTVRTCVERCGPTVEPHVWGSAPYSWTKGGKGAYRVIPNFEILDFDTCFLRYPPQEECSRCVGGISLICVRLDDYSLVHVWWMAWFVFTLVVWMYLSSAPLLFVTFSSLFLESRHRPLSSLVGGWRTEMKHLQHDRHLLKSRNCLPTIGDTQFPCNRPTRRYVPQKKGVGWIQHLDAIHFLLLHYRRGWHSWYCFRSDYLICQILWFRIMLRLLRNWD